MTTFKTGSIRKNSTKKIAALLNAHAGQTLSVYDYEMAEWSNYVDYVRAGKQA